MSTYYGRVQVDGGIWSARIEGDRVDLLEGNWLISPGKRVKTVPADAVTWLPPVEDPTILCVGRNYRAHAAELNNEVPARPLFFLKQRGALTGHESVVHAPGWAGRIDYEGELVLVMGRTLRNCRSSAEALEAVAGITIGNDITARDLQKQDGQWTRAKGLEGFAPVGPFVAMGQSPAGRRLTTRVNDEIRQDGLTDDMIFPCDHLIMEASQFMTLRPGDLIFTGTPSGIGPIQSGDVVRVSVEGVGTLSNSIIIDD